MENVTVRSKYGENRAFLLGDRNLDSPRFYSNNIEAGNAAIEPQD